jgi:hypothetical protein
MLLKLYVIEKYSKKSINNKKSIFLNLIYFTDLNIDYSMFFN